jgi:hypothetical protein
MPMHRHERVALLRQSTLAASVISRGTMHITDVMNTTLRAMVLMADTVTMRQIWYCGCTAMDKHHEHGHLHCNSCPEQNREYAFMQQATANSQVLGVSRLSKEALAHPWVSPGAVQQARVQHEVNDRSRLPLAGGVHRVVEDQTKHEAREEDAGTEQGQLDIPCHD